MAQVDSKYKGQVLYDQEDLDNGRYGIVLLRLILTSDLQQTTYYIRPVFMLDGCPGFTMLGRAGRRISKQSMLLSLPMWAKFARLRIDEIPMVKLLIRLKEPFNKQHIMFMKQ